MLTTLIPPVTEPLTVAEVADFLRLPIAEPPATDPDEAPLLAALISSARQVCEQALRRRLLPQTLGLTVDYLPDVLRLPCGPIRAVLAVEQRDVSGGISLIPSDRYIVSGTRMAPITAWPEPNTPIGGFRIVYETGLADTPEAVPAALRQGMLMLIAHWYERREAVPTDSVQPLPFGVAALWHPFRMFRL